LVTASNTGLALWLLWFLINIFHYIYYRSQLRLVVF
jgi:hypothetical protein